MPCLYPFFVENPAFPTRSEHRKVPVPCNKCPECLKRKSSAWAFRLLQQEKVSDTAIFLTLTYDTEHVPISPNGFMTANGKHFQLFMKRLRKSIFGSKKSNLKYYAVIEYGSKRARPHFHAIMFNVPDVRWFVDSMGNHQGQSSHIDNNWSYGGVDIRPCNGATVAYVCKYLHKGKSVPMHRNDDRVPERAYQSVGLGINYLDPQTIAFHKADLSRNYVVQDGFKKALPRYYKDKLYTEEERISQGLLLETRALSDEQSRIDDYNRTNPNGIPYSEHVREARKAHVLNFKKRANDSRGD